MEISTNNYVAYHVHTDYSLLDSCTDYHEYVDLAAELGQTAIAFSEHGMTRGWESKYSYCEQKGIKYLHAVEIYLTETHNPELRVRDNYHTILIAKNQAGFEELNRLVGLSTRPDHFYYVNRLSFEEFIQISPNIITTSACLASPLNKLDPKHPWYEPLVHRYDYLEIQPHNCQDQIEFNQRLYTLSRQYGKPLIAGTDAHSATPYLAECRDMLLKAKRKSYGDEDAFDLTYKSYEQLVEAFAAQNALNECDYLQAIENTNVMAAMCEPVVVDRSVKYPILYGSPEKDEEMYEKRVWSMFQDKLDAGVIAKDKEETYREALKEELRVFHKLGMAGFMLSESELICWCKENGIPIGPGRGSVGGSRAAYVTGVTEVDPERWGLVFSRFANENRVEPGDIDTDLPDVDRPKIFNYILERFGARQTARVAAYGTLAEKATIKEIGRAIALKDPTDENILKYQKRISAITSAFEEDPEGTKKQYPKIFYYYDGMLGTRVSQSIHPAGMVISPVDLDSLYGVFDKDGERCLFLDMNEAHDVGLVKYDFLALRNIQIIQDACDYAGIPYPKASEIDFNDPNVWKDMMRSPIGVFQFEGAYAYDTLKRFNSKSVEDMSVVTAVIRPGCASFRDNIIARKQNKNPLPEIDALLSDTNGYIVYQEDSIKFLQEICGMSGSEADTIRRAIGKKKRSVIDAAMPKILDGYCAFSPKPREEAEEEAKQFLQVLEDSASYSFNKSHSIAYSIVGYYCAWLRCYHPIEFITALLNNAANDDDVRNGTQLAAKYGFKITSPKWGASRATYFFDREAGVISKGLASIKYLGQDVAEELYALAHKREYKFFIDVLNAINDETTLDSRQLDILIKIDFFSEFGNQRELMRITEMWSERFKKGQAKQIKRSTVDGTFLEPIIKSYATWTTKAGTPAANYTLLDTREILLEIEASIKDVGMEDLPELVRIRNFTEALGYAGYTTGKDEDRPKLYVTEVYPLRRKSDGHQFGYSVSTRSIGSGIESKFTVTNGVYNRTPIKKDDVIYCRHYIREGQYFKMTAYDKLG